MPRTTNDASRLARRSPRAARRSKPFCSTMREIIPISGRDISGSPGRVDRQTIRRQHRLLRGALPGEIIGRVRLGDVRVACGIPSFGIDAVEDADQIAGAPSQDALESEAELRRLNLARVGRAHRRDEIGVVDAAFEQADAPPELHLVDRQQAPRQIETRQPVRLGQPLVRKVVDGEDARHAPEHRVRRVERLQIDGREPALPVVRVDHRGARLAIRAPVERGAREHGEAPRVVRIVGGSTVDELAIVQVGNVEQQDPSALPRAALRKRRRSQAYPPILSGIRPTSVPSRTPRYRGTTTVTSQPSLAIADGSAPRTSASPPVFENGTASEPIMRTERGARRREAGTVLAGIRRSNISM